MSVDYSLLSTSDLKAFKDGDYDKMSLAGLKYVKNPDSLHQDMAVSLGDPTMPTNIMPAYQKKSAEKSMNFIAEQIPWLAAPELKLIKAAASPFLKIPINAALTSGVYSGADTAIHGGNLHNVLDSSLVGALAGAGVGSVGSAIAKGYNAAKNVPTRAKNYFLDKAASSQRPLEQQSSEYMEDLSHPHIQSIPASLGAISGSPELQNIEKYVNVFGNAKKNNALNNNIQKAYNDYAQNTFDTLSGGTNPQNIRAKLDSMVAKNANKHRADSANLYESALQKHRKNYNIEAKNLLNHLSNPIVLDALNRKVVGNVGSSIALMVNSFEAEKNKITNFLARNKNAEQAAEELRNLTNTNTKKTKYFSNPRKLHELQSKLGKLERTARNSRDYMKAHEYKVARNAALDDLYNGTSPEFQNAYNFAKNHYRKNVVPYDEIKAIRDVARSNKDESANLSNVLIKNQSGSEKKVLNDLGQQGRNLVVADKLNSIKNLNKLGAGGKYSVNSEKLINELQNFPAHSANTFLSPDIQQKIITLNALKNIAKMQKSEPISLKDSVGNWKSLAALYGLAHHPVAGLGSVLGAVMGAKKINNILRSPEIKRAYLSGEKIPLKKFNGPNNALSYLLSGRPTAISSSYINQALGDSPNGN